MPVTLDGELKVSNHLKWIIKRRVKDLAVRTTGHFNKIDLPGRDDVLVGKGKPFQDHRGNVVLRQLVELRLEEYNAARKGDKTTFTRDVVQLVKGRFVKKDKDGWWEEVSEAYAREKVVRVFGSLRMKSKTAPLQEPVFVRSRMEKRARVSSSGCCGKSFDYT